MRRSAARPAAEWLIGAKSSTVLAKPEISQNGLPGDRGLPLGDQHFGAFGQVYVEPRSETDQPEALSGGNRLSFANERYDPPRQQAGDLDHADAALWGRDYERIALVVLARLVELGIDEDARSIRDAVDPSRHRTAVYVAVEHAHEYRDARQRPVAEAEFGRRQYLRHHRDTAIGRRHHDAFPHRRHPHRVAEKQGAPDRQQGADPPQRRPDPEQDQARKRKAADKRIAFGMNRRNLRADGIGNGHGPSLICCPLSPVGEGLSLERSARKRPL